MAWNRSIGVLALVILMLSACGPDTIFLRPALDTPMQHVKNGQNLLARGKVDAANEEFLRAKGLDQGYAPAYVGIALIQGHRGDVTGGFEILRQAKQLATTPEEMDRVNEGFKQLRGMLPESGE